MIKKHTKLSSSLLSTKCTKIVEEINEIQPKDSLLKRYVETFFENNGIKIISTTENINYSLKECEYYLLENMKVAKFLREDSISHSKLNLFEIYEINDFDKIYKQKKQIIELNNLIEKLIH